MYQYKVRLDVYGGEATVGSVDVATRDYWIERGLDSLESHVTRDDATRGVSGNMRCQPNEVTTVFNRYIAIAYTNFPCS